MVSVKVSNQGIENEEVQFLFFSWPSKALFTFGGRVAWTETKMEFPCCRLKSILKLYSYCINIAIIALSIAKMWIEPSSYGDSIAMEVFSLAIESWYIGTIIATSVHLFTFRSQEKILEAMYALYVDVYSQVPRADVKKRNLKVNITSTVVFLSTFGIMIIAAVFSPELQGTLVRRILRTVISYQHLITTIYLYFFQLILCHILMECENQLSPRAENTKTVLKIYQRVQDINDDFNSVNSIQTCMLTATSLVAIIKFGFKLGCKMVFSNYEEIIPAECFYFGIRIFQIVALCSIGSKKLNRAEVLYKKVKRAISNSCREVFHHEILLTSSIADFPLILSAGLFNLNLSFLVNISGIVITYWVILIQFEMGYDSSKTVEGFIKWFNGTGI